MNKDCIGCGCLFLPYMEDKRCPYCGGGRGFIVTTPIQRIRALESKVESLEIDLETLSSNALKRIDQLSKGKK